MTGSEHMFREKDFALAMQGLEPALLKEPGWSQLLYYEGISGLQAGYNDFYWSFLDILRKSHNNRYVHQSNEQGWKVRVRDWDRRVKNGQLTLRTGFQAIRQRMVNSLMMRLDPLDLPVLTAPHRALVVRSFRNTSPFPVLKCLAQERDWQIVFASWNPRLQEPVADIGIPFILLPATYRRKYAEIKNRHTVEVMKIVREIDPFLPVALLSRTLGLKANYDARHLVADVVTRLRNYTDIYLSLIMEIQPNVVILFNETSLADRLMAMISAKVGVPSVALQHGLFIGYVYQKLATDKLIVWGAEPKRFWEALGCESSRVISVGAFAHKNWQTVMESKPEVPSKNHPQILFLGQNPAAFISPETHYKTVNAVFQAAQSLPEYSFLIRPHPAENPEPYYAAYKNLPSQFNIEIRMSGSIENVILESDLVITVFSTAGLESMLLEKPVVVLNLSEEPAIAPYVSAAKLVESAEILTEAIREIMQNADYRQSLITVGKKYANDYVGPMDGQAVYRAVRAIQELAEPVKL